MKRTTIMADERLIDRLREIARREKVSLAEIIRQALELRVLQPPPRPKFIGVGASGEPPHDLARQAGDISFEPRSWR